MDSLAFNTLSAVDARRLIASRQVSPVELLEACIAQMHARQPAVNALAATRFEHARAKHASRNRPSCAAKSWACCTACRLA